MDNAALTKMLTMQQVLQSDLREGDHHLHSNTTTTITNNNSKVVI
jgi:hypothetical protein